MRWIYILGLNLILSTIYASDSHFDNDLEEEQDDVELRIGAKQAKNDEAARSVRQKRAFKLFGQFIQGKKIEKVLKAGARYLPYPNSRRGAHMYIKHGGVERLMSDITAIKSVSSNIHTVSTETLAYGFVADWAILAERHGVIGKPTLQIIKISGTDYRRDNFIYLDD